jgi:hypothetical protein
MQYRRLYKILWLLIAAILLVGCIQEANPNLTQAGITGPPASTLTLSDAFLQAANIQLSPTTTLESSQNIGTSSAQTILASSAAGTGTPTSGNFPLSAADTQTAEAYPNPPAETDTPIGYPGPTEESGTPTSYPGPTTEAETPTSYPGPTSGAETPTSYPGPGTPTVTRSALTLTPVRTPLPNVSSTPFSGLTPTQSFFELTQTAQAGTPGAGFTPAPSESVFSTQKPISTSQPPQNLFQTVTIWH